tara:strand:+ start:38 stop:544 length:507 start_codon:yes stop_codon:yes gene_type:complete
MSKSVNLYLALGVSDGVGFWLIDFTEHDNIITLSNDKFLECYRKELFGFDAAIQVKEAIKTTLDILLSDCKQDGYKLESPVEGYSSEIPLKIIEDIFDIWADNYCNEILWKKYIGLLNFRKKLIRRNKFITVGLKGNIYKFAIRLEDLLSYRPANSSLKINKPYELMW